MNITETDRVIHSMMTENTGRHFLDSGGYLGRTWERNQGKTVEDFLNEPPAYLDWTGVSLSMFHWLRNEYEFHPVVDAELQRFMDRPEHEHTSWLELSQLFSDEYHISEGSPWSDPGMYGTFNTYNDELLIDGVMQYTTMQVRIAATFDGAEVLRASDPIPTFVADNGDECEHDWYYQNVVLINFHGGADVRGGYAMPRAFVPLEDELGAAVYSAGCVELTCDNELCHWGISVRFEDVELYNYETQESDFVDGFYVWDTEEDDDGKYFLPCPKCDSRIYKAYVSGS